MSVRKIRRELLSLLLAPIDLSPPREYTPAARKLVRAHLAAVHGAVKFRYIKRADGTRDYRIKTANSARWISPLPFAMLLANAKAEKLKSRKLVAAAPNRRESRYKRR